MASIPGSEKVIGLIIGNEIVMGSIPDHSRRMG